MWGFTYQLAEHRAGNVEVTGFESRLSLIVFSLLPSSCLNCDILTTDSLATLT